MSRQLWTETLLWTESNGANFNNTTTETILFPNFTIPANYMQDGKVLRLTAMGKLSNIVTTPGNLNLFPSLGRCFGNLTC